MKPLTLLIFLLVSLLASAQQMTWNTLLPDYYGTTITGTLQRFAVRQMAKTANNEYVVLMNKQFNLPDGGLDTTVILKYDDSGQLIWEKKYYTRASYRSMHLTTQGEIVLYGSFTNTFSYPFLRSSSFLKLSHQGDSLYSNIYNFSTGYFTTQQSFQENDNSYWVTGTHTECHNPSCVSNPNYDRVLNIDSTGVVIDSLTAYNVNNSYFKELLKWEELECSQVLSN